MLVPVTIRISNDLLRKIKALARELNLSESEYLRRVIEKGLHRDLEETVLEDYRRAQITLSEAARRLGISAWDLVGLLSERGMNLNVSLKDWLDSATLEEGKR